MLKAKIALDFISEDMFTEIAKLKLGVFYSLLREMREARCDVRHIVAKFKLLAAQAKLKAPQA